MNVFNCSQGKLPGNGRPLMNSVGVWLTRSVRASAMERSTSASVERLSMQAPSCRCVETLTAAHSTIFARTVSSQAGW